jgi:hypothetical protein
MGTQSPPCWQALSVHWIGSHSSRPTAPGPPVRVLVGHSKQVVWPCWGWKKLRGHWAQGERPVSEYWPGEHLAATKIQNKEGIFFSWNEICALSSFSGQQNKSQLADLSQNWPYKSWFQIFKFQFFDHSEFENGRMRIAVTLLHLCRVPSNQMQVGKCKY